MNKQTLNIQNSTVGDVNQVAAKSIEESFNKVTESSASAELKETLTQLNQAVTEMLRQLPEEQQNQVANDLKILTDEATAQSPRRKWYELSAEGLITAAKAVGDTAIPVITAAKAVIGLLTGS